MVLAPACVCVRLFLCLSLTKNSNNHHGLGWNIMRVTDILRFRRAIQLLQNCLSSHSSTKNSFARRVRLIDQLKVAQKKFKMSSKWRHFSHVRTHRQANTKPTKRLYCQQYSSEIVTKRKGNKQMKMNKDKKNGTNKLLLHRRKNSETFLVGKNMFHHSQKVLRFD